MSDDVFYDEKILEDGGKVYVVFYDGEEVLSTAELHTAKKIVEFLDEQLLEIVLLKQKKCEVENLLADCKEILFELMDKAEINNEELIMYG